MQILGEKKKKKGTRNRTVVSNVLYAVYAAAPTEQRQSCIGLSARTRVVSLSVGFPEQSLGFVLSADGDYADYLHGRSMHDRLWVPGWEHRDQAMLTTIATWLGGKIYVSRCGVFCVT